MTGPGQVALHSDVVAKIEWAEKLLRDLDVAVREYVERAPFGIRAEPSRIPPRDGLVAWNAVGQLNEKPPVELALLAGDVAQNIRGALDYLARALVFTSGGTPVDGSRGTQFPVLTVEPPKGIRVAGCESDEILSHLRNLQPYRSDDPTAHPLARLDALNNTSKHRTLPLLTGAGGVPAALSLHTVEERPWGVVAPYARWFFDGDRLDSAMMLFPPDATPVAEGIIETVVSLQADAWLTVSMVDELDFYLRYVRDYVIPYFEPFFAPPWPNDVFAPEVVTDPMSALPPLDPHRLVALTRELVDRIANGHPDPRIIVMGMLPGVSVAMGYHTGELTLAGQIELPTPPLYTTENPA